MSNENPSTPLRQSYICINTYIYMRFIYMLLYSHKKNRWKLVWLRCAVSWENGEHINSRDLHDILSQPSRPLRKNCCRIKWWTGQTKILRCVRSVERSVHVHSWTKIYWIREESTVEMYMMSILITEDECNRTLYKNVCKENTIYHQRNLWLARAFWMLTEQYR